MSERTGHRHKMSDKSRLHWQCRRGMRELDILLERYLENSYAESDSAEKSAFRQLLTLSDPELAAYLLRGVSPDDVLTCNVIARILRRTTS
jgi:antitoxin CptB